MIKITKNNVGAWWLSLSQNVKFTSGAQMLERFLKDANGQGGVGNSFYTVGSKSFKLPVWAARVANTCPNGGQAYNTGRTRDMYRVKKHAFRSMLESVGVI